MTDTTRNTLIDTIGADAAADAYIGAFFIDEDIVLEVVEYNKGWFTSRSEDGVEQKDRLATLQQYEATSGFHDSEEDEAATGKVNMASQLSKYRANYKTGISSSGRKSLNNGDKVATALEMMELHDLFDVVEDLFELDLRQKYERLNAGAQRMNLGNRIRSAYKKDIPNVVAWVNETAESKTNNRGEMVKAASDLAEVDAQTAQYAKNKVK
jgi:hypothetical protein